MKQFNTVSFKGQVVFVGLDVHKNSIAVCIRHLGQELKSFVHTGNCKELAESLKAKFPEAQIKSVYEAGFCGFSHHRLLVANGIENIVVNPADIPTSNRERVYKNDACDCRKLARELENGSLVPIYVPKPENLLFRSLVRRETQIIGNITRAKNRLKQYFHFIGLPFPGWSSKALKNIEENATLFGEPTILSVWRELRFLREERLRLRVEEKNMIRRFNREIKQKCLESVPGIGFRSALIYQAELWEMERFTDIDHYNSYLGLRPHIVGSEEHESAKKPGERKKKELHYILIEAAWRSIGTDMDLRALYGREMCKGGTGRAISIVARKLAARMRAVFIQEREYVITAKA